MSTEIKTPDLSGLPLVMVRDTEFQPYQGPHRLIHISERHGRPFFLVVDSVGCVESFRDAKPYAEPRKRPMTHAEIFKAIREGAVVRFFKQGSGSCNAAINQWSTNYTPEQWEILLTPYTGTDSDAWQSMEVEE